MAKPWQHIDVVANYAQLGFYDFSSFESKGNFIFQSKLLQKVNSKETDRFKIVIHLAALTVNPDLKNIEATINYAYHGRCMITKVIKENSQYAYS